MSLIGIKCDDLACYGEEFTFDECVACSLTGGPRRCHTPTPLIVAMAKAQHDRKDAGISATMLLDCPRKVALQSTEDWTEHPEDFWYRFRGSIAHMALEHYAIDLENVVCEVRRRKTYEVDGVDVAITGKPDLVDAARGFILDYKTCNSVGEKPISLGQPKPGHEEQVNIYADLCDGGVNMDTGEIERFEINLGGIHYMAFSKKRGGAGATAFYRKVPVRIWSADERHAFIVDRLRPIAEFKRSGKLPGLLMDEKFPNSRSWKCADKWCALRDACDEALDANE